MTLKKVHNTVFGCLLLAVSLAGCKTTLIQSNKLSSGSSIEIDGSLNDWSDNFTNINDISFQVMNDEKYLYLSFYLEDRKIIKSIFSRGLIIWFDHSGGMDKILGIRFPLGFQAITRNRDGSRKKPGTKGDKKEMGKQMFSKMMILEYGDDLSGSAIKTCKGGGVDVCGDMIDGCLTYELKVPLRQTDSLYGISEEKITGPIGVRLITPDIKVSAMPGGGKPGGGMGGDRPGGGMGSGRPGGRMGGPPVGAAGGMESTKKIEIKAQILLSNIE